MLKKIIPSGIRSQLIIGIACIIVLSISLFVADLTNRQKAFFLKLNHDTGIGLSDNLANISTSHVVAYELDGLQKLVGNYKKMPGLEYAMVTTSDGIVLSHTDERHLGLKATDSISNKLKPTNATQILLENNNILDVTSPIINHSEIVGWARIGLSQKSLTENLREIRERGILYVLISLVISSVFAMLVAGRLTKGLLALITAAKKIKDGDRDLRVVPSTSIELNQLGTAFNQMLDDISANEKLLNMVLENMPVGVFILDAKGKVLSLNPAAQQIWEGAKYVDRGNYNVYKGWFPNGKEIESYEWGAAVALKEDRPVLNQEAEIECFNGNRKTILNSCIPMHDANNRIVGVISINLDITERKHSEIELRKKNHDIGERIKELGCLYRMSQLSNDPDKTIQDIAKECVSIMPSSYQFPDITCARIEFEGQQFESVDFKETTWKQEREIISKGIKLGKVQVYYKEQKPEEVEGPFLEEERLLINSIADILGSSAERKNSELELIKSEERNRALIENISDTIILLNRQAEVVYQSPAFIHTAGFSMEELNGKTVFDFIHPEDRESSEKLFKEALDSPGVPLPNQYRIKHRQGHYIWVEGTTMNLLNNESVKALIINYRDISERKKFEEQQRLMTSIVNSSEDAIISKSLDGIVTSWNHGAESILGYSANETIGNPIKMIIPPHLLGEEVEILNRIKKGESIDHFETVRRKKNGDLIYVSLTVSPIFDSEGNVTGASKILRNINDKKQMELEREKTMTELLQRNRDLEQFSYIVSHNLRGPVATILGLSDILQSLSLQQEEKDHLIKGMGSSVQKLDMVIRDLNTILKVRRDLSEKKTLIHFSELVHDIKASLNSLIDKEKVQFVCDFKATDEITTIKSYLYSIFYNLISNSIKYRKPNAEPLIEIRSEVDGQNIILYFKDNGLGIDLQKKGKDVFGLYKRFHLHIEGKGMGLFMVKTQVETLGGKISIQSQENVGTEFKIEFKN